MVEMLKKFTVSSFLKWFLLLAVSIAFVEIVWIYRNNTVEEANIVEVISRGRIKISVTTEPKDVSAKIFINDVDTEKTTPALLKVSPGIYTIKLVAEGYQQDEKDVIVKTLRTTNVGFVLKKN